MKIFLAVGEAWRLYYDILHALKGEDLSSLGILISASAVPYCGFWYDVLWNHRITTHLENMHCFEQNLPLMTPEIRKPWMFTSVLRQQADIRSQVFANLYRNCINASLPGLRSTRIFFETLPIWDIKVDIKKRKNWEEEDEILHYKHCTQNTSWSP